jgi:hypothetical protein
MKKILLSLLLSIPFLGFGQSLPLLETFNYVASATDGLNKQSAGVWSNVNTGDSVLVTAGSLSYTGSSSSAGNKISIDGSGTDVNRSFDSQTTKVYYSFMLNLSDISTLDITGGYFTGLASSSSNFGATIWTKKNTVDPTKFNIGISARSNTPPTFNLTNYSINTTYLVVLAYELVSGTTNDKVYLWVNPSSLSIEPTADQTLTNTGTDLTSIQQFFIRQDSDSETPFLSMDELRVALTYSSSTLPISLTSFTGKPVDQSILLNWTTASESNNDYFEVLKSTNGKNFSSVGTLKGSGTTTDSKSYSFVDVNPAAGTNYYQLVQYDFDGKSSKSEIIPVNSAIASSSLTVYAAATSVNVSINSANQTDGTLQIFDITGKKLNETKLSLTKGFNTLSLPLSLNSGIHVVNFVTGAEVISSKFIKE